MCVYSVCSGNSDVCVLCCYCYVYQVKEVRKVSDGNLTVCFTPTEEGGREEEVTDVDCMLWAIGRDANDVDLGLQEAVSGWGYGGWWEGLWCIAGCVEIVAC